MCSVVMAGLEALSSASWGVTTSTGCHATMKQRLQLTYTDQLIHFHMKILFWDADVGGAGCLCLTATATTSKDNCCLNTHLLIALPYPP
jgi:hypothetical protein